MDARSITGRNINTGEVEDFAKTGSWAGAMLYMSCVDHIGSLFTKYSDNDNDFLSCLKEYNLHSLSDEQIKALYALRNAFVHDFGLFNIKKNKGVIITDMTHSFTVTKDLQEWVVALPKTNWDGDLKNFWHNKTFINLFQFGELVERIYKTLVERATARNLKIYDRKDYCAIDKVNIFIQHAIT